MVHFQFILLQYGSFSVHFAAILLYVQLYRVRHKYRDTTAICPKYSIIHSINDRPHSFSSRSLDVAIVGDDDGLNARARALQSPDDVHDDVGHIQCISRSHDACLEQLQARMGDGMDFLLQNSPLPLVKRVEVGRARRPH